MADELIQWCNVEYSALDSVDDEEHSTSVVITPASTSSSKSISTSSSSSVLDLNFVSAYLDDIEAYLEEWSETEGFILIVEKTNYKVVSRDQYDEHFKHTQ